MAGIRSGLGGALLRPGSRFSFRVPPSTGWAERRQAHYVGGRACVARPIRTHRGAAIAVVLVTRGAGEIHASLIIATALGIGLTVLLGTGLMALMFVSSSSGHDDSAGGAHQEEQE